MKKLYIIFTSILPIFLFSNDFRHEISSRPIPHETQDVINEMKSFESTKGDLLFFPSKDMPISQFSIGYHYIKSISAMGNALEIEDGSVWRVSPEQRQQITKWGRKDPLAIMQNNNWFSFKDFSYKIINENNNETVYADLHLGPLVDSKHTHHIISIDHKNREIVLDDQSVWKISYLDGGIFKDWALYDAIIVGFNSSWASRKKMLLINVNMNNYIRANQL